MPRRKKPKNETPEQAQVRKELEAVANHAPRSDKTSWNRKMKNMDKLITRIRPIENQIIALRKRAEPVYDDIANLRAEMVKACVHPFELMVHKSTHIECKFCMAKIGLPNIK